MSIYVNAYSTVRAETPWTGPGEGPTYRRTLVVDNPREPFLAEQTEGSEALDLQQHIDGFAGYAVDQGVARCGEYNPTIHSVARHITQVRNHYVFERPEDFAFDEFTDWAKQANAIFFMPDGTVRDPAGGNLLAPPLSSDESTHLSAPHTELSLGRRDRIRGRLWEEGVRISPFLPPVTSESEIVLRRPAEVLDRARGLNAVARIAVDVVADRPAEVARYTAALKDPQASITAEERSFLDATERFSAISNSTPNYPDELKRQAFQAQWGFVSAEMLAWVIGAAETDPFELNAPEPERLSAQLDGVQGPEFLRPRTLPEICDALEYTFSMRWFAVDQALKAKENAAGGAVSHDAQASDGSGAFHLQPAQESILLERHRALSWLSNPKVAYEDVDLST